LKQIDKFGGSGENILDYSVYDAIKAGFKKVTFIIREDFADEFRAIFEPRMKGRIGMQYAYQQLSSYTGVAKIPPERTKPWGTAHAILCAKAAINEPFAVINADDFYGRDAFEKAYSFLRKECHPARYAMVGYELPKTLSEFGSVSRGICTVDQEGELVSITERTSVYSKNGKIYYEENGLSYEIERSAFASMNFWCFHPSIIDIIEAYFADFLTGNINDPKAEFFIPAVADLAVKAYSKAIKVILTDGKWFGVTYKADKLSIENQISRLIMVNEYPWSLWGGRRYIV
jgi:hypothetical protein